MSVRPNVRKSGDDLILAQYERQIRLEAEAERNRLWNQAQLDERHALYMLGQLLLFGVLVTAILVVAWVQG